MLLGVLLFVAVVSMFAAIAIPAYQDYTERTQLQVVHEQA